VLPRCATESPHTNSGLSSSHYGKASCALGEKGTRYGSLWGDRVVRRRNVIMCKSPHRIVSALSILILVLSFSILDDARAQEDFVVTVGTNKVFQEYNIKEIYQQGSSAYAYSDGQTGTAQVSGSTLESRDAVATAGVHFSVAGADGGNFDGARISITFHYRIEASLVRSASSPYDACYGHAQAWLNTNVDGQVSPVDGADIDLYESCETPAPIEGTLTKSYPFTKDSGYIFLETKAHTGGMPDGYYTSFAKSEVTVSEIKVEFGPSLTVSGPRALVLYNPPRHSPAVKLTASGGTPPGGFYDWEILQGSDKVQFMHVGGSSGEEQYFRARAPSKDEDDVTIKVTYTVDSQIMEGFHSFTVQKPTSLYPTKSIDTLHKNPLGFLDAYTSTYYFYVMDQLGYPILIGEMPVREERKIVCRYPLMHKLDSANGRTTDGGFIIDDVGTGTWFTFPSIYPFGIPKGFYMTVQQKIHVGNIDVGTRCQIYYWDHALSVEGSCTKCR
jgi:hypothetical protein